MSALGHRHRSSKLKKPKKTTAGGPALRRAAGRRNDEIVMPVPFRMHPIMSHQSPVSIHAPATDDLMK